MRDLRLCSLLKVGSLRCGSFSLWGDGDGRGCKFCIPGDSHGSLNGKIKTQAILTVTAILIELNLLQSDLSLRLASLLPLGVSAHLSIGERVLKVHPLVPGSSFQVSIGRSRAGPCPDFIPSKDALCLRCGKWSGVVWWRALVIVTVAGAAFHLLEVS